MRLDLIESIKSYEMPEEYTGVFEFLETCVDYIITLKYDKVYTVQVTPPTINSSINCSWSANFFIRLISDEETLFKDEDFKLILSFDKTGCGKIDIVGKKRKHIPILNKIQTSNFDLNFQLRISKNDIDVIKFMDKARMSLELCS